MTPSRTRAERPAKRATRAERLGDLLTGWADRLPPRLRRIVPRELAGFAMLGGFTFAIDLAALAVLRHWTRLPLPAAVSIAYAGAFAVNFALNRTINFRSHAPVGRQLLRYAAVALGDYLITVVVTTGLTVVGLDFRVARVAASGLVAVFTYTASRWWVFRDGPAPRHLPEAEAAAEVPSVRPGRRSL